jgi:hypothetical protein
MIARDAESVVIRRVGEADEIPGSFLEGYELAGGHVAQNRGTCAQVRRGGLQRRGDLRIRRSYLREARERGRHEQEQRAGHPERH